MVTWFHVLALYESEHHGGHEAERMEEYRKRSRQEPASGAMVLVTLS